MIIETAYAKLNLFLEITGRRPDGYHELVSVMQTVSLSDTLTAAPCEGGELRFTCDAPGLPTDGKNLVVRAANAFFAAYGTPFGVTLRLHKVIPAAAGLGGGSADAAATLRALNRLAGAPFSPCRLREIAATLGADIPFLVEGGTALCEGIGERLTPVPSHTGGAFVVAIRGEGVSTPAAYAELDRIHENYEHSHPSASPQPLLGCLAEGAGLSPAVLLNSLEAAILPLRPAVGELKAQLSSLGAAATLMSGSGPSVFGWFEKESAAQHAARELISGGAKAFACRAVPCLFSGKEGSL